MFSIPPLALAAFTGFLSGFILSIPVGPINLTILNEGARCGFKAALLISIGAVLMELIYCAIAFTGFASFFQQGIIKASMELFSFVFMLYLGIKFLLAKSVPGATRIETRIEQRLHPHSAFMIGFVRTMANPGVLLGWIILSAGFISHDWVQPTGEGKAACILGVAAGTGVWFLGLSWVAARGHGRFTEKTLLKMEHVSGVCMLVLAMGYGANIIWQLARHRVHG
jgi:threonine/homoserine/homoserine lactone efflux protein